MNCVKDRIKTPEDRPTFKLETKMLLHRKQLPQNTIQFVKGIERRIDRYLRSAATKKVVQGKKRKKNNKKNTKKKNVCVHFVSGRQEAAGASRERSFIHMGRRIYSFFLMDFFFITYYIPWKIASSKMFTPPSDTEKKIRNFLHLRLFVAIWLLLFEIFFFFILCVRSQPSQPSQFSL